MNFFKEKSKPIAAFLAYLLAASLLTWPLITDLSGQILGTPGDAPLYLWNAWWFKYSLFSLHSPFFSDLIAHPLGANLAFSSLTLTNSLYIGLIDLLTSPVVAFNIFTISSMALAAFGMYLLVDWLVANKYAAFIGGAMFAFNSVVFNKALGHYNYLSVYLIPFFLLFFAKIFIERKKKQAVLAAIFLALSFYNDYYYTLGLIFFASLIGLWCMFKQKTQLKDNLRLLGIFLGSWLVMISPLLILAVKGALAGDFPLANLAQVNLYSADPRSFFIPPALHTVFGSWFVNYYNTLNYHNSTVYVGFSLLVLALVGYFVGKETKQKLPSGVWAATAAFFFFFALGPLLYLDGTIFDINQLKLTIPLPYLLVSFVPFIKGILVPARLIIFMDLALIVLASFALKAIFEKAAVKKITKFFIASLFIGIFIFENISVPLPVNAVTALPFYEELGRQSDDFTLLELPFALSTSFYTLGSVPSSAVTQYYQAVHHKKILGGWISRVPDSYYEFYAKITGLDYLINPQQVMMEDDMVKTRDQAKANFQKLGIRYVIIHPEFYSHRQLRNTIDYLTRVYEAKPVLRDGMLIYALKN